MPLDPEVLRARIALRIARLEVECARLARHRGRAGGGLDTGEAQARSQNRDSA